MIFVKWYGMSMLKKLAKEWIKHGIPLKGKYTKKLEKWKLENLSRETYNKFKTSASAQNKTSASSLPTCQKAYRFRMSSTKDAQGENKPQ